MFYNLNLTRGHSRRDLSNRIYASDEVRAYAIERADQLQAQLEGGFPSFVKPMLQSHVTGGFWLVIFLQSKSRSDSIIPLFHMINSRQGRTSHYTKNALLQYLGKN